MNFINFFLLSILLVSAIPLNSCSHISELFETWCKKHGKTYSSEPEKQRRLHVFEDNYAFVTQFNSMGNASFSLSLNAFADLTHDEFKATHLGFSPAAINLNRRNVQAPSYIGDIPDSLDWRDEGAVTRVKDQDRCDAPWAFAAVGAIEGINKIVTGSLVSLSEEELIDCDTYNNGCEGGVMDNAYQFVIDNHGIDSEEDYPYQVSYGCYKEALKRHIVTIDGYTDVPANNETLLLQAVAAQPVSAGICTRDRVFHFYRWGIFDWPCSTCLDHAVLITGYGSVDGVDYWIAKNSWGIHWDAGGYIYLKRNTGNPEGLCGINMLASYPIKTSQNPPPRPPPIRCDIFTFCEGEEACCCSWRLFGICFWGNCCEFSTAVSCEDQVQCCPSDYPVWDTKTNQCLKGLATVI